METSLTERFKSNLDRFALPVLIALTIVAGIFIRFKSYLAQLSLYIDEANVARNIAERGYPQLFENFDYNQYFPPVSAILVKLSCDTLGYHEIGLRFIPFVAGLLIFYALFKLMRIAKLSNYVILFVLFAYAFSHYSVGFSQVLKQYTLDLLIAIGIMLAGFYDWSKVRMPPKIIFLSLVGSLLVWTSMPSVFGLAALGTFYFAKDIRAKKFEESKAWIIPILSWLISFTAYYFLILKKDVGSGYLQEYHNNYFLPLFPTSNADLTLILNNYKEVVASFLSADQFRIWLTMPLIILGTISLFKKQKKLLWLIWIPVALTLVASMAKQYSLIARLIFFLAPYILIATAQGVYVCYEFIKSKSNSSLIAGVLLVGLSYTILHRISPHRFFKQKFLIESTKRAMVEMNTLGDPQVPLIVHYEAAPAYLYYVNHHPNREQFRHFNSIHISRWGNQYFDELVSNMPKDETFWILYGHTPNSEMKESVAQIGKARPIIESHEFWRAGCYSFGSTSN